VDLGPKVIKPGLKSTQKSPLKLPSNSGRQKNWDKFGSAQETEICFHVEGPEVVIHRPPLMEAKPPAVDMASAMPPIFHGTNARCTNPI
jgi:hypothetical protein